MKIREKMSRGIYSVMLILFGFTSFSQDSYLNNAAVNSKLSEWERQNKNFMKVQELAKTAGGESIMFVTLGTGDVNSKPAIVVAGGISGSHLLGIQLSLKFIENVISTDSLLNSLSEVTYYVFPNMSPDASKQYFSKLKYEREANTSSTDDDRDGRLNEDPFDDLDDNGMITWMRIKDNTGEWMTDPADPRALKKINRLEGEKGTWRVLSEGRDNDGDSKFNEDGEGGVNFNKNFTYDYPWFTPGAGEFQVSEIESRALLDLLYERTNVFAIVSFGPSDNLSAPMKHNAGNARKRVVSSILQEDAKLNETLSKKYNAVVKPSSKKMKISKGGFMEWGYFHFGRLSLGTPGFHRPDMKKGEEKSIGENLADIRWVDSLSIQGFTEWTSLDHPDFPGNKVEVGGLHPFVVNNPPLSIADSLAITHTSFIADLASMRPNAQLENIKVEPLGKGIFRVTVDFFNSGELPALTQMGERVKWVMKPKVTVKLASGMTMVSGNPVSLLDQLKAGAKETLTWLIKGKGSLEVNAGAPQMGQVKLNVELK